MNGFLSFVKKETLHILRDPYTMLIALLVPVVQTLLFGFAISVEIENLNFMAVAPRGTEAVRQSVERLSSNPYFTFKGYATEQQAADALRRGDIDVFVMFAPDYDRIVQPGNPWPETAVNLVFDASNPNTAGAGAAYIRGVLDGDRLATTAAPVTRLLYNPQMKSAYNFVPGIMGLIFILICAIMTSVSIVREKETGTMEVLLVSPVRPIRIIFAKMLPYFILSCINLCSILLLAYFVLGMPSGGSVMTLVLFSMLYLLLALSLGLLISTFSDRQSTALIISAMLLMFPIIMLSGMIFPIENMPQVLQYFSSIVPARWYIAGVRKLMIEELTFSAVLSEFAVLGAMTVAILALALKKFNDRLQ